MDAFRRVLEQPSLHSTARSLNLTGVRVGPLSPRISVFQRLHTLSMRGVGISKLPTELGLLPCRPTTFWETCVLDLEENELEEGGGIC